MPSAEAKAAQRLIGPAITDVAGEPAGATQLERLIARYHWTSSYCSGREVAEIACGTGQGLGLLGRNARRLFACDLSDENLDKVRLTYGSRFAIAQADAQALPFEDNSLDVIVLLETLYFLPIPDAFLAEVKRVLRPGGYCLLSCINKDCPDFNPNHPLYFNHYGAPQLSEKLRQHGFEPECFGIIPMDQPSIRSRVFKPLKQMAVRLNLIPESMQARLLLKRIVFGRLDLMPHDISVLAPPIVAPASISSDVPDLVHQVVLCAGVKS
ncbi:MAG: class I SAM-dependent methyltransferase [Gemmatimonadales bacterium]